MSGRIAQSVYMGVGVSGAMTDVSSYVDLAAGISYSYGRASEFDDAAPGTFSFTLDNPDGRFTPENTASPYVTKVTEGMQVCWQAGSRLRAGSIIGIEPAFPGDDAAWSQVVITCDDMLGAAARASVDGTLAQTVARENAYWWFPLDDAEGAYQAEGLYISGGDGAGAAYRWWVDCFGATATYGVDGIAGVADSQVDLAVPAGATALYGVSSSAPKTVPATQGGPGESLLFLTPSENYVIGAWVTPMNQTSYLEMWPASTVGFSRWGIRNGNFAFYSGATATWSNLAAFTVGRPYYVEMAVNQTTKVFTLYIDGVQVASSTDSGTIFERCKFVLGDAAYGETRVRLSQLVISPTTLPMVYALPATASQRLTLLDYASADITFSTLPSGLSSAELAAEADGSSVLDVINDVIRAEQGHVYTTTTGTVSSPTQRIVVRERDRPVTVSEAFEADDEATGAPAVVRDVTNLAAIATIEGPTNTARATISTTRTRATISESVPLSHILDLRAWGEDRLIRGANTRLRVETFTVDAFTTPTDRSGDLLALVPGDRVQITDLPSTVLGFSTWDGWLLGADEFHSIDSHAFTLKLQPVLDADSVYDTARYMSDGEITLNAAITASATSVVYATAGAEMEATAVPYTITVDSEQMTVTAVNTGTNTLTVTRGVNGTTAAAHSSGAAVELTDEALYAF